MYDILKESIPFDDENLKVLSASAVSAFALTTLTYPLDLCHTRMSSDMTKKQSLYNQNAKTGQSPRLYTGVVDCVRKSQK